MVTRPLSPALGELWLEGMGSEDDSVVHVTECELHVLSHAGLARVEKEIHTNTPFHLHFVSRLRPEPDIGASQSPQVCLRFDRVKVDDLRTRRLQFERDWMTIGAPAADQVFECDGQATNVHNPMLVDVPEVIKHLEPRSARVGWVCDEWLQVTEARVQRPVDERESAFEGPFPFVLVGNDGEPDLPPGTAARDRVRRRSRQLLPDRQGPNDVVKGRPETVQGIPKHGPEVCDRWYRFITPCHGYLAGVRVEREAEGVRVRIAKELGGNSLESVGVLVRSLKLGQYGVEVRGSQGKVSFRERQPSHGGAWT
jgi:hypothetical protein